MTTCILNPIGIEESLLTLRLLNQGADAFYLAEIRLQEKMKPARLSLPDLPSGEPK